MKKITLLLFLLLLVTACTKETPSQTEIISSPTTPTETAKEKIIGPGGCIGGPDCGATCGKNPLDCRVWCKLNKEDCIALALNSIMEMPEGIPNSPCAQDSECTSSLICLNFKCDLPTPENIAKKSGFGLPGNCKEMAECATFCQKQDNSQECASFCSNFPSVCAQGKKATASAECQSCLSCDAKDCILDCTDRCYQYMPIKEPNIEILKQGLTFTRNYQEPLKAVWEPGPAYNRIGITYFVNDYKELGVNTYSITPKYNRENGKLIHSVDHNTDETADKEKIANIIKAKKAGFQVVLVAHDLYDMFPDANDNEKFTPETYSEEIKATSLKWAKIAEEYQVEYFVPINEFEYILYENGYSAENACAITNKMYAEVIPKVREIFTGKIYCRVGGMDARFGCMDFSQCDIFGFTYGFSGGKNYQANFNALFKVGEELSQKYNKPYLMAEAFSLLIKGTTLNDCAALHQAGMQSYNENAEHGIGYTFMGLVQQDPIKKNDCTIKKAGVDDDYKEFFKELDQKKK